MGESAFLISLGARIKAKRVKKNLSQSELSMRCNFEKASMSRIEAGKTNISVMTLYKISEALEVKIADFFKPET